MTSPFVQSGSRVSCRECGGSGTRRLFDQELPCRCCGGLGWHYVSGTTASTTTPMPICLISTRFVR